MLGKLISQKLLATNYNQQLACYADRNFLVSLTATIVIEDEGWHIQFRVIYKEQYRKEYITNYTTQNLTQAIDKYNTCIKAVNKILKEWRAKGIR